MREKRHGGSSILSSGRGAVRIVREIGRAIAQVARDLGINAGSRCNWVAKDRAEHEGKKQLSADDAAELRRCAPRSPTRGWSVMSSSDWWSDRFLPTALAHLAQPTFTRPLRAASPAYDDALENLSRTAGCQGS